MKKVFTLLLVLLGIGPLYAQQNALIQTLGFEQGFISTSNWRSDTALCCPNTGWYLNSNYFYTNVTSSNSFNNYNLFPPVDPKGGNHSVQLGLDMLASPMVRLMDTLKIDSFNYYFQFSIAGLRQTWPGMPSSEGVPYFRFQDLNGNPLAVSSQIQFNGVNNYNWQKASFDTSYQYFPWTDQYVNLFAYAGQKIIITYELSNVPLINTYGAISLAYFDLRSVGANAPKENYCGGSNLELDAPSGIYDSIVWKNNVGTVIGRGMKLILQNLTPSNVGDSIQMNVFAAVGSGSNFSYWHTLKMAPTIFKFADFNSVENCVNNQTQFNFIGDTTVHINSYQWNFGDPASNALNTSTASQALHNFNIAASYPVKLVVTNSIGCVDSITKTIAVGISPNLNAGADFSVCPLQVVNLNGSLSNASSTMLLHWQYQNSFTQISSDSILNPAIAISSGETFVMTVVDTFYQCHFSDTVLASIQTVCINHAPIANNDTVFAIVNNTQAQYYNVLINDVDHDGSVAPQGNLTTASLLVLQNPRNGTLSYTNWNRVFSYIPNTAFAGLDTFSYILSDNGTPNFSDTALVFINVLPNLQASTTSVNLVYCGGSPLQLNPPLITGGTGNYAYYWQPLSAANLSCNTCPNPTLVCNSGAIVMLTVSDLLFDSLTTDIYYNILYDTIYTTLGNTTVAYGDSISVTFMDFGSYSPMANIIWTPNLNCGACSTGFYTPHGPTYLHFQASNNKGCTLNDSFLIDACTNDCVWPGDCNHDGIVDNFDVLNIGLGYGWTGTSRSIGGGLFQGIPSNNWNIFTAPTIDAKHADADGDGLIDANDTADINFNFGLTHPKQSSTSGIPLYVEFSTTSAVNGDHVYADIYLGSATIPADSIYGVAFTFSFDSNVVVPNSAYIHRVNSNWLANPGFDGLDMSFNQFSIEGDLHYALVRTDHTVKSGYGPVARADMDIQTGNIAGKGNQLKHYKFIANLKHVRIVDLQGNEKSYTLGADTVDISYFTGISSMSMNQVFSIAPNPSSDYVRVQSLFPLHNARVEMFDMKGMQIGAETSLPAQGMNISTSELKNGVYLLQINAAEGVWKETIIVQH